MKGTFQLPAAQFDSTSFPFKTKLVVKFYVAICHGKVINLCEQKADPEKLPLFVQEDAAKRKEIITSMI